VTVTVQLPTARAAWPENAAALYQEIVEEDRRLAEAMSVTVRETWPPIAGDRR
jgi:hypothetical protein